MGQSELKPAVLNQVMREALRNLERRRAHMLVVSEKVRTAQADVSRDLAELHSGAAVNGDWIEARLLHQQQAMSELSGRIEALESMVSGEVEHFSGAIADVDTHLQSAQQARQLGLSVIKAQEEERRRVAREIHDGPAQILANVVLRIDVCQKLFDVDPQRARQELGQLKELVRLSLQDVRKIIFDLRPMALDDLGLIPALRAYLKDFQQRTAIECDFAFFGQERRFDSTFEVAMFRLMQEALSNVAKHARATQVWVSMDLTPGRVLRMTIRDNGVGFNVAERQAAVAGKSFGLLGMRERAGLLSGSMDVQSTPGQGTRLSFAFPLGE